MDLPRTTALDLPPCNPLPEDIAALFAKCRAKLGLIPNVLLAYARDPDKLRAFSTLYNDLMLGDSGLSKLEREMIAVAVSAEIRCWYCLVAHGAAVRELSGDPRPWARRSPSTTGWPVSTPASVPCSTSR